MYAPRFELKSFEWMPDADKVGVLVHLLEGLIAANVFILNNEPSIPWLYDSGVRYVLQPPPDRWQDIEQTLAIKQGECEDLGAWRVAELRVRTGEFATPRITWMYDNSIPGKVRVVYHVQVFRGDGVTVEDPSEKLGMRPLERMVGRGPVPLPTLAR